MICALLLYLKSTQDTENICWKILSNCRLRAFSDEQQITEEKNANKRTPTIEKKRLLDMKNNLNEPLKVNVTSLVLKELQEGFFAAVREGTQRDSTLDATVCVSEPTVLECMDIGFGALLLATLDHVLYCRMLGIDKMTIFWKNCQTCCVKDPQENSWPAYFEPLNTEAELNAKKVLCLGGIIVGKVLVREYAKLPRFNEEKKYQAKGILRSSLLDVGFRKRQSLPGYEEGAIITPQLRKWVHDIIREHVRPQESIQSRMNQFYMEHMHGYNMLGVHVRGTDHAMEMEEKKLPAMEKWIQDAETIFKTLEEPKKIFLAGDNNEIIDRFVGYFEKDKVVYTSAIRANKYQSLNPINGQVKDIDPIETGSQVLIDILLLAKCGHFLHAESSVATLASFFNPEMELHFLGSLEENGTFEAENGDLAKMLDPQTNYEDEIEWENCWEEQIEDLAWCYRTNSPYSACPNMAAGQLIDSSEVRTDRKSVV